ncbi:MAG: ABC transporter permease [Muribaculaceae bacterium]|nr:ABC transporter permease [Muribaculaceae bacterium]
MEKLRLIIAREYMTIVGRKSFIVMTLLIPIIMMLCMALPAAIAYFNNTASEAETVAVIDESGRYGAAIADNDLFHFVPLRADTVPNAHEFYKKANGQLAAVVVIPADVDSTAAVTVYSENTINVSLKERISRQLSDTLTRARVASYGVPGLQRMIDESSVNVDLKSVKWDDAGNENETSAEVALAVGLILAFLTYMFVLLYGAMIMNGVIEEKTNRIVEVIVSSCKPFQLMMGKIIGVALVGLTQLAIWVVLMTIVGAIASTVFAPAALSAAGSMEGVQAAMEASDNFDMAGLMQMVMSVNYVPILVNFVLYFIGGYLLYASLFAGFGSAVDQASDASQATTPIIMIMVVALYAGMACIENPNGPMAVWCSMIPFTSPVVMMVRLPYDVPLWQLALSIVLLYATAAGCVWVAARIYRTGILLYGKKHSFKEILRWIKG